MNEKLGFYPPHPQPSWWTPLEAKYKKKAVTRTCAVPVPLF